MSGTLTNFQFDVFRNLSSTSEQFNSFPWPPARSPAVLLYRGLMKGDGQTEFQSRFLLPCDGTETLLRVRQTECPINFAASLRLAAIIPKSNETKGRVPSLNSTWNWKIFKGFSIVFSSRFKDLYIQAKLKFLKL